MATTKSGPGPEKVPTPPPATRAAEEIQRFHALGRRVHDRAEADRIPLDAAARRVSTEEGLGLDAARKAARFAGLFDDHARDRVCLLCRIGRRPLSVNHVRRILKLKKGSDRLKWLKLAAKNGWTADRLELAMRLGEATEKGGAGGPRIGKPYDLHNALLDVIDHSREWKKRYEGVWRKDEAWPPILGVCSMDLEASRVRLTQTIALLEGLRDCATSLVERLTEIDQTMKKMP
jgi:hypothetical protein